MGPDSQVLYYGGDGVFQLLCLKKCSYQDTAAGCCLETLGLLTGWLFTLLPGCSLSGLSNWLPGSPPCLDFPSELYRRAAPGTLQLHSVHHWAGHSVAAGTSPQYKKDH